MIPYNVTPVTVQDYRRLARRRLPRFLFDYLDGGAGDESSMAANEGDFRNIRLKQRVMMDVDHVDTGTTLCGRPSSMPLALAPVGMAGLYRRRGEVQGALAAQRGRDRRYRCLSDIFQLEPEERNVRKAVSRALVPEWL